MKSLARLILFFTSSFLLVFLGITGIRFLLFRLEAARMIPALPFYPLPALTGAGQVAIPGAVYIALMLSLSYAARKRVPPLMIVAALFSLSLGFGFGLSLVHARFAIPAPDFLAAADGLDGSALGDGGTSLPTLGGSGLRLRQGEMSIIVLGDPADGKSPRIIAIPGEPLVYMSTPREIRNTPPRLPPAPFHEEKSAVAGSLLTDFTLTAEQLGARFRLGPLPFLFYLGSLCLLLVSFHQIFETTAWPLINMLLGAMVFRGMLAFQTFIDSDTIQNFIFFFLGKFIPKSVISPAVFGLLGILALLYTVLANASRGRRRERHG